MRKHVIQVGLFAVLCGVVPVVGMDEVRALRDVATIALRQIMTHHDLFDAAKNKLPEEYDGSHLCIEVLDQALSEFRGQKNLYARGNHKYPTSAEELAKMGERAMQGAKYLVHDLINQRKKDKQKHEEEKNEIFTAQQIKLNMQSQNNLATMEELKDQLSELKTVKNDLIECKKALETREALHQEDYRKSIYLASEKNRWKAAFVLSLATFVVYFVYVQWNYH